MYMYIYMYVYMYVYIYVYMYIYIYVYIYTCVAESYLMGLTNSRVALTLSDTESKHISTRDGIKKMCVQIRNET